MKVVKYEDVPALCSQLLHEVETTGVTIQVNKDGRPFMRMVPVDEATRSSFAAMKKRYVLKA